MRSVKGVTTTVKRYDSLMGENPYPRHPLTLDSLKKRMDKILRNHHRKMEAERKRYERRAD